MYPFYGRRVLASEGKSYVNRHRYVEMPSKSMLVVLHIGDDRVTTRGRGNHNYFAGAGRIIFTPRKY